MSNNRYFKLYEYIFKKHIVSVVKDKSSPFIGITEHIINEDTVAVTAINYSEKTITFDLEILESYDFEQFIFGKGEFTDGKIVSSLEAGEMCILLLNKK